MSRGGDSQSALRKVWMEGYRQGRKDEAFAEAQRKSHAKTDVPVVQVNPADIAAVYAHDCANPEVCPACKQRRADGECH